MELMPGARIDHFLIESLLGRGGMGVVYLALDERLGRKVALKLLGADLADDSAFRMRFEAEARLAASLDEPHIVPVHDLGEFDGCLYIVMRYVAGFDLATVIARHGRLTPERSVGVVVQVAQALDAAHAAGLVHRDVKPANILVASEAGGADQVYLTDFGLALGGSHRPLTRSGQLVGSLDYLAPEQIDGRSVDARADIYALGGVLFACLSGRAPFLAPTEAELLYAHLRAPPPLPSHSSSGVPPRFDDVVAKAMSKDPDARYARATELADAAKRALLDGHTPTTAEVQAPARAQTSSVSPTASRSGQVRKTVTVIFADLVGSTAMGEQLDPEALESVLQAYFEEARLIVERHGGVVEKFIGDAVVGVFGMPNVHEDDALRAARAAIEIAAALERLNAGTASRLGVQLVPRVGINSGEVVAADRPAGMPVATGDAVNIAARLQQSAGPGEILLGETTWRLIRGDVTADPVAPIAAKGKSQPVAAYVLREVGHAAQARTRTSDAPLIGRDRELGMLRDRWHATIEDRTPRLVTLLGMAGVGKSRLVQQLAAEVTPESRVISGRCLPYGEGITYWPVRAIVHEAAHVTESDSSELAISRLVELFGDDPQAALLAERVATAVGLTATGAPQQEVFWAVRRMFERLGRVTPVLIVLEDLAWAQPTLLEMLRYAADLATDSALMFLATARPEILDIDPGWGSSRSNAEVIRLEPLPTEHALELVRAQPGGTAIPADLAERICDTAEGNPLFVGELMAMLRDEGSLRVSDRNDWSFVGGASVALPPTVRTLLAARMDSLPPDERLVAERASVIGRQFERSALAALVPADIEPELDRHLLALVRRELLQPDRGRLSPGDAYRFRHILVRDAAYASLPKSQRAELHRLVAEWVAATAGDRLPELAEICGYHLEQAHRHLVTLGRDDGRDDVARRACAYLEMAGKRAHSRGDTAAAENLFGRALVLETSSSSKRARLLLALARAQRERGDFEPARLTLSEARDVARSADEPSLAAQADIEQVLVDVRTAKQGWVTRGKSVLRSACQQLTAADDEYGLALCRIAEGTIHELEGRNGAAARAFSQALSSARRAGDRQAELECLSRTTLNLILGDAPVDDAIRQCEQVLSDWPDQPHLVATTLDNYALLLAMSTRFDEARDAERRALAISADLHDRLSEGLYRGQGLGAIEALAGDLPTAAEHALWGCEVLRELGERAWLSSAACILGEVQLALGDPDAARHSLALADETAAETDIDARTRGRTLAARLAAVSGDIPVATEFAAHAVRGVNGSELLYLRGIAMAGEADVLRSGGKSAQSRRRFAQAIALHQSKGDLARVARVRNMSEGPEYAASIPLV